MPDSLYAQRYDNQGVAQGNEFLVNTTTAGDQMYPAVAMDSGDDILITWASNPNTTGSVWTVSGRQFSSIGTPLGDEFQVNTTTGTNQNYPSVAMNNQGNVVSIWQGSGQGDSAGIFMQQYIISFSVESVDGFYAQYDPNDPDQAHPASPPVPLTVTPPVRENSPGGDLHDHDLPSATDRHRPGDRRREPVRLRGKVAA